MVRHDNALKRYKLTIYYALHGLEHDDNCTAQDDYANYWKTHVSRYSSSR